MPLICKEGKHPLLFFLFFSWLQYVRPHCSTTGHDTTLIQVYIDGCHGCTPTWRQLEDNFRSFMDFLVRTMGLQCFARGGWKWSSTHKKSKSKSSLARQPLLPKRGWRARLVKVKVHIYCPNRIATQYSVDYLYYDSKFT